MGYGLIKNYILSKSYDPGTECVIDLRKSCFIGSARTPVLLLNFQCQRCSKFSKVSGRNNRLRVKPRNFFFELSS